MPKSHKWLGTSIKVERLNTLLRGKNIIVELAGWIHESLHKVRGVMVKPWAYHCVENRPEGTFHGGDPRLFAKSPIDADWLEACALYVVKKVQDLHDIVTDHGSCTSGKIVLVFETTYGPKENGVARALRDALLQAMFTSGSFSATGVPDCLIRMIARKFQAKGWTFIFPAAEGEATIAAGFGVFDHGIMTSDDVDARYMLFKDDPTGYLIYPRRHYHTGPCPTNNLPWPAESFLGVLARDADWRDNLIFLGKNQVDISFFSKSDQVVVLLFAASDYVHEPKIGPAGIIKFIIDTLAKSSGPVSPLDLIKGFAAKKKLSPESTRMHMDAFFAYVLHPVTGHLTRDSLEWHKWNLLRVDTNDAISGWHVQDLIAQGLPDDSPVRRLIIPAPVPYEVSVESIDEFRMKNDHSCPDLNVGSAEAPLQGAAAAARDFQDSMPPLSQFKPVNNSAPRMPLSIIFRHSRTLTEIWEAAGNLAGMPTTYYSSHDRGERRVLSMKAAIRDKRMDQSKAIQFFVDEDDVPLPNGRDAKMVVTATVPRMKQQAETHRVFLELLFGYEHDENEGGDILVVKEVLRTVCACVLMAAEDCTHRVRTSHCHIV